MNDLMTIGSQQVTDNAPSAEQAVKLWTKRIKDAKAFFDSDFKRMRENMEFAAGLQWQGQTEMDDKERRYMANFLTKHINDKVASLYAKDPKVDARRRARLDFAIWDGTVEQEQAAMMAVQSALQGQPNPQAEAAAALLQDIEAGKQWQKLCTRVGETLKIVYEYQCDTLAPSFKFQLKHLVRRTAVTGVGFVRMNYINEGDHQLSSSLTDDSLAFRIKRAKSLIAGIQEDKIQSDDPRVEQLKQLFDSIGVSIKQGDLTNIEERIEFDFPSSTSIIVDPKCQSLKGFVGAEWIAQQYIMPLESANAYFKLTGEQAIKTGGTFIQYADDSSEQPRPTDINNAPVDTAKAPLGCFWEIFDLTTKESFYICDGWKDYVQEPKALAPSTNRFWPIFALTFNDIVCEPGQKVHIYPPSDVQLLKPIQVERNRTRDELKKHREVNRPFFWAVAGTIDPGDEEKLMQHETGELIRLKKPLMGSNGQENVEGAIGKWSGAPIDQSVYNSQPLEQDASLVCGSNQVQNGAPIKHVAATPAVIQEQARMSGVSSNVDDLDDLLSEMAQAGGEIILRAFQKTTVERIAGKGAVFPDQQREDFLNEIFLVIVAASSGRPNKAVDIQNAQQLVPMMLQAGANPWGIIQYLAKVLDANINPVDFAPLPQLGGIGAQQQGQPSQKPPQGPPTTQQPGNVGLQQGGQGFPAGVQRGGLN